MKIFWIENHQRQNAGTSLYRAHEKSINSVKRCARTSTQKIPDSKLRMGNSCWPSFGIACQRGGIRRWMWRGIPKPSSISGLPSRRSILAYWAVVLSFFTTTLGLSPIFEKYKIFAKVPYPSGKVVFSEETAKSCYGAHLTTFRERGRVTPKINITFFIRNQVPNVSNKFFEKNSIFGKNCEKPFDR